MGRKKGDRVKKTCTNCGKEFEVYPCVARAGNGRFCSKGCATTYRNNTDNPAWRDDVKAKISANHADVSGMNNPMYGRRGEDAPSYIDGRTAFSGEPYRRVLLASGREKKCAVCGATEKMHVHHVNGNHSDNRLENLMWLCAKCHNGIAHTYERDRLGRFVKSTLSANLGGGLSVSA